MSIPSSLSDLLNSNQKELDIEQKIVEELLNTEKNLDTKTELSQPLKWSILNVLTDFLKNKQLVISNQIMENFMKVAFKYLISKDRKGRLEYIQALQSIKEKQQLDEKIQSNGISMKVNH